MSAADSPLTLRSFGITFGAHVVLSDVSLRLPARGMTVLVGPVGSGKSTLLRTLAGHNRAHPELGTWGEVELPEPPSLIGQHARFYVDTVRENLVSELPDRSRLTRPAQTEAVRARLQAEGLAELERELEREVHELSLSTQRRLAVARALIREPRLLLADEPTAGLDGVDGEALIDLLRAQAERRSVVLVTHDQRHARRAGGTTILLGGGRVLATQPTAAFFDAPDGPHAETFVRTGGLPIARPGANEADLADDLPPEARPAPIPRAGHDVVKAKSQHLGPRGFFWILPGRLGGTPRPGIVDELIHDLEGLRRLEVTVLVNLEEQLVVDPEAVRRAGIEPLHVPIVDMKVPTVEATMALCAELSRRLRAGAVIAIHCRAGLGRTGTILACQLIHEGASAVDALDRVRAINPRCVQSDVQVEHLSQFARATRPAP